ncbi:type II secretion system F family protein [Caballeronia sp.]|uniref:type II secretion system F family protein n=1 Tax=Caballeronia sp. TaxID=1931223 RepID=UPI003C40D02D
MNPADIVTASGFVAFVFVGLIVRAIHQSARSRAPSRIKERLSGFGVSRGGQDSIAGERNASVFKSQGRHGSIKTWFDGRVERLGVVAGARGVRLVAVAAIVMFVVSAGIFHYSPLPGWGTPLAALGFGAVTAAWLYRKLIKRYQTRFLMAFPDTLDLVIRAVRAGVPVTQAIITVGEEVAEPVRSEFKTMGNSLKLGIDMNDVLDVAVKRIAIPDFSFFSVCLLLQRETGGQLGETLENLSAIIRSRRDLRLKTRALTAETRVASKIISAIPFFTLAMLYTTSRSYLMILFDNPSGHTILFVAAGLLVTGMTVITKMSNLDTSR